MADWRQSAREGTPHENETLRCAFPDAGAAPVGAWWTHPMTNRELTKTLGRILRRPTLLRVPAFVARIAFGEMVEELLLASARVAPRVCSTRVSILVPYPRTGLRHLLGRGCLARRRRKATSFAC